MASSQQNKVVVHVKSTSRFEHDTDDGRGFKRGRNHEQSNPKDNFRGGLHRGRGTSSHRGGHTRKDHSSQSDHTLDRTAVEVCVVLDQATISDAYKGRDKHQEHSQKRGQKKEFGAGGHGHGGERHRGPPEKPYRGNLSDHDQFASSTKHKPKNPSETFKSDFSSGIGREKDRSGSTESGKPKGFGQGRGRSQSRGRDHNEFERGRGENKGKNRESGRDYDKEIDEGRGRGQYRGIGQDRGRDQDRSRDWDQDRGRGQDRSRGQGQDRGRGDQDRGRGQGRGRGQSRDQEKRHSHYGGHYGSKGIDNPGITTPQIIVVNNYIVQESKKKGKSSVK